jgi:hypothetical protein
MRGTLAWAASAFFALVLVAGGAAAEDAPSGSYQDTCSDISMDGHTLNATCRTFDQDENQTSLPYANSCVGVVSNVDGVLACTGPTGSYALTCRNASVSGNTLTAECQRRDGTTYVESSVEFSGFQHPVTNCDGQLVDRPDC